MLQVWFFANTILWPFSITLGGLTLQPDVILLGTAGIFSLWRKRRIGFSTVKMSMLLLGFLMVSFVFALAGPCTDKFQKSLITVPIFVALVVVGLEIGRGATQADWLSLQKSSMIALSAAFAGFLVEWAAPSWFPHQSDYRAHGKFSGLFLEPSEVASSLFPCIAILLLADSRRIRRWGIAALLGLLLVSRSSTLLALIAAWTLYRLIIQKKFRQSALLALVMAGLILAASVINYDELVAPTVDRIAGVVLSNDTDNLSSMVYVQGWQDAWSNLLRTHGIGLGFNMMGCHALPDVPARQLLTLLGFAEINADDGSFQFAKIVSEFGLAGIAFYGIIIWWWIRLEKRIRGLEPSTEREVISLQAALIFCFVASSFIRTGSYFSGGLLLWLVAACGAAKWQRDHLAEARNKRRQAEALSHAT